MSLHDLENSINISDRFYFICGYTDEIIKTSILKVFCNTATSKFSISYKNPTMGLIFQVLKKIILPSVALSTNVF